MSKVFGMHVIALKPGVKAEDFEKFVTEVVNSLTPLPGMKEYFVKGDRGDREGKYLFVTEFESVETRDRYFPSPGEISDEVNQVLGSAEWVAAAKKWDEFATPMSVIYTDYVVVD
jgi:hypothetical protein